MRKLRLRQEITCNLFKIIQLVCEQSQESKCFVLFSESTALCYSLGSGEEVGGRVELGLSLLLLSPRFTHPDAFELSVSVNFASPPPPTSPILLMGRKGYSGFVTTEG